MKPKDRCHAPSPFLSPRQKKVLRLRRIRGWKLEAIAKHEGVTRERIRQILLISECKLRVLPAKMRARKRLRNTLGRDIYRPHHQRP